MFKDIMEIESIQYSIKVDKKDLILVIDNDLRIHVESTLFFLLEKEFNIFEVDYNGHFSSKIFFSVLDNDNTIKLREDIIKYIDNYIKELKKETQKRKLVRKNKYNS